eukprot:38300-Eustigmatos_ZCMA.PRE.1
MVNLAVCYAEGRGVDKDMRQAVTLFEMAVEASNPQGMFNLGMCYKKGEAVHQDMGKPVGLFERAARLGHTGAKNQLASLGACYEEKEDFIQAMKLYCQAAEQGHAQAKEKMRSLICRVVQGTVTIELTNERLKIFINMGKKVKEMDKRDGNSPSSMSVPPIKGQ